MIKIKGLVAATFSTFHEDGSLHLDLVPGIVDKLIRDGVSGVFVCGTNGEGPNMTIEERIAVAEAYAAAAQGRLLLIVHVGHPSIAEAKRLAKHAASIGADAISSVAAFYFRPTSVTVLADSMAEIASAAPATPFYYYHIPALTGVGMDMVEFLRLAGARIPNLAGIKYTAATIHEYQACLNYENGKYDILFGYDELLLPALAVGAEGAVGSTYNFAAPLYLEVVKAFRSGDMERAREIQLGLVEMILRMVKFAPIPAQKAIMEMVGYPQGPCRLPLTALSRDEKQRLRVQLDEVGFFERINNL